MTKNKKPNYEILDLEGYWTPWTWSTLIALRDKEVGGHVDREFVDAYLPAPDGDPKVFAAWQKAEAKAMKIIDKRISGSVRRLIVNKCNTAVDIWEHLRKRCVLVSQRRVTRLTKALEKMEWDGRTPLANFIAKFKEKVDDIQRSGGTLGEETIADKLLAALPESWGDRVDVWQTGRKSLGIVPNFDDVEEFLIRSEEDSKKIKAEGKPKETALSTEDRFKRLEQALAVRSSSTASSRKCWYCGEADHLKSGCSKFKQDKETGNLHPDVVKHLWKRTSRKRGDQTSETAAVIQEHAMVAVVLESEEETWEHVNMPSDDVISMDSSGEIGDDSMPELLSDSDSESECDNGYGSMPDLCSSADESEDEDLGDAPAIALVSSNHQEAIKAHRNEVVHCVVDTAASAHMFGNHMNFDSVEFFDEPNWIPIAGAGSQMLWAIGKGTVRLCVFDEESGVFTHLCLSEVLYVPRLHYNLCSIPKMMRDRRKTMHYCGKRIWLCDLQISIVAWSIHISCSGSERE